MPKTPPKQVLNFRYIIFKLKETQRKSKETDNEAETSFLKKKEKKEALIFIPFLQF